MSSLRSFEHWNVVWQCAVPFLIIAGLVAGAFFVKNKLGQPTSDASVPVVQADPGAWEKMTDLTKAGQAVEAAGRVYAQTCATLAYEENAQHHLRSTDPLQQKGAEERVRNAQVIVNAAKKQFDAAYAKYQQLGGTTDYRTQFKAY